MNNIYRVILTNLSVVDDLKQKNSKKAHEQQLSRPDISNNTTSGAHETINAHHYLGRQESGIPVKSQKIAVTSSASGGRA